MGEQEMSFSSFSAPFGEKLPPLPGSGAILQFVLRLWFRTNGSGDRGESGANFHLACVAIFLFKKQTNKQPRVGGVKSFSSIFLFCLVHPCRNMGQGVLQSRMPLCTPRTAPLPATLTGFGDINLGRCSTPLPCAGD